MSTYSLSGAGVQALSAGVTAVHVTITTLPIAPSGGSANPTNYYHVGMLRFGDAVGYFDAIPIVGGPQWLAVPSGTTRCGYSLSGGSVISLVEVIGGTPPFGGVGALSSLSDVALTSPADTQLLTYQASSGKWINANAPTGGGGTLTTATSILASPVSCPTAGTFYDAASVSLVAGTWFIACTVTLLNSTGGISIAAIKLWDGGSNLYGSTETITRDGSQNYSLSVSAICVLSGTTTVKVSATWNNNNGTIAASTTNPGSITAIAKATQLNAVKVA
jgi:hypothetical protein